MVNLGILEYDDLLQGQKKKGLKKEYFPETEDSPCDQLMVVSVVGYGAGVVNWRVKKNSRPWTEKQANILLFTGMLHLQEIYLRSIVNRDIISVYHTCVIPVFEYCASLYHRALPMVNGNDSERVKRSALSIIYPGCGC